MPPKYSPSSVEPILEASEDDESRDGHRDAGDEHPQSTRADKRSFTQPHTDMTERSRRRVHKDASSVSSSRHGKSRKVTSRRSRHCTESPSAHRSRGRKYRRTPSTSQSPSSYSSEDEVIEDHQAVLAAARNKLTSESMNTISTTLTTATNNSSSSSGSNSTITQASMSKSSSKQSNGSSQSSAPSGEYSSASNILIRY